MPLLIRPASDGDLAALLDLAIPAWAPVFASFRQVLGPDLFPLLHPDWRAQQRATVERFCGPGGRATVLVAEVAGAAVGFVAYTMHPEERTGEVALLAVHPDHQNRGIGTALNRAALERMQESGVVLVSVGTGGDPGHAPARRAYEKAGFTGLPLVRYYQRLGEPPSHP